MEDLSLHVLDIVENSIRAGATEIKIELFEDPEADILRIDIADNGKGMDEQTVRNALDPFFTSKPDKRVGLGIPLFFQAAREGGGAFDLQSKLLGGTKISASFRLSHPDRKPTGDMDGTVQLLKFTHPDISFSYTCNRIEVKERSYETETGRSR